MSPVGASGGTGTCLRGDAHLLRGRRDRSRRRHSRRTPHVPRWLPAPHPGSPALPQMRPVDISLEARRHRVDDGMAPAIPCAHACCGRHALQRMASPTLRNVQGSQLHASRNIRCTSTTVYTVTVGCAPQHMRRLCGPELAKLGSGGGGEMQRG